jgi:hypothetical protein
MYNRFAAESETAPTERHQSTRENAFSLNSLYFWNSSNSFRFSPYRLRLTSPLPRMLGFP